MEYVDLSRGLNTSQVPERIGDGQCVAVLNWAFSRPGSMSGRLGYVQANRDDLDLSTVLGIHQMIQDDGTEICVVKKGTSLFKFSISSVDDSIAVDPSAVITGMKVGFRPHFATFGNAIVIFDGSKNYIYDGTHATELGRDAPEQPTLVGTTGGALTPLGVYYYRFTYYSTALAIESEMSPEQQVVLVGAENAVAVDFTTASLAELDAVWDKIRVYRSMASSAGAWYYAEEVTADYTDLLADSALGVAAVDTNFMRLPGAIAGIEFEGRYWAAIEDEHNACYFSEIAQPHAWKSTSILYVGEKSGDRLLGFAIMSGRLVALKRDSMWALTGYDPNTYAWQKIDGARGGVGQHGICDVNGTAYVFNVNEWIYRVRGGAVHPIGVTVDAFLRNDMDLAHAEDRTFVGYEPEEDAVWFSYRREGTAYNDRILVFFLKTEAWSVYDIRSTCMARVKRATTPKLSLLFGGAFGSMCWAGEGQNDGSPGGKINTEALAGSDHLQLLTPSGLLDVGRRLSGMRCHVVFDGDEVLQATIEKNGDNWIDLVAPGFAKDPQGGEPVIIAGIDKHWVGKNSDLGSPFYLKRASLVRLILESVYALRQLGVTVLVDGSTKTMEWFDLDGAWRIERGIDSIGHFFQVALTHLSNDCLVEILGAQIPGLPVEQDHGPSRS